MKNRLKAILLAAGLTVSLFGTCAFAETATEAVTGENEVTEAVTEKTVEKAEEEISEAQSEAEAAAEAAAETAAEGKYAAYYDSIKESIPQTLQALSAMSEEQLDMIISDSQNTSEIAMASHWKDVREELGNYVEVTSQEITEESDVITVTNDVVYDGVNDKTQVIVTYEFDVKNSAASLNWEIKYPMGKLMEQAGLNTIMGMGVVFCVLIFLSLIIGQLHWIPDLLNGKKKEQEAAVSASPVTPVPAPAEVEEEELTDDLELVAVISAAIAASENTSADGFVVRSIKKANRRNWLNA